MTEVVCRSQQQIMDDELLAAHSELEVSLKTYASGRPLFVGERRRRMEALKVKLEAAILGETNIDSMFTRGGPRLTVYATTFLPLS